VINDGLSISLMYRVALFFLNFTESINHKMPCIAPIAIFVLRIMTIIVLGWEPASESQT